MPNPGKYTPVFEWIEPKGVTRLRDLVRYGNDPFWEKLTFRRVFGYLFIFLFLFFAYYFNHYEEPISSLKLVILSFCTAIALIIVLVFIGAVFSCMTDTSIFMNECSICIHPVSNVKQIKWRDVSNIELLSGRYQAGNYNALVFRQAHTILEVIFISDIIQIDYLIEFLDKIGKTVTRLDLIEALQEKGIPVADQSPGDHSSGRSYKYPKEMGIGHLGFALTVLVLGLVVGCLGFQKTIDEQNEIYYWYAIMCILASAFMFGLFMYNKYSQKISIENPYLIQRFKMGKTRRFNLSDAITARLGSGESLVLGNSHQKISVDAKLISFLDFCNTLEKMTGTHIFRLWRQRQQYNLNRWKRDRPVLR
jgi:hypothetical protein